MTMRPRPETFWDWLERGWRVVLAWICIILVMVPLCICAATIMIAFTYGFINSIATGEPMPDLTAGLDRVLPSIMPYVGPALAGLLTLMLSRHREVNTSLGGGQDRRPLDRPSLPPSPSANAPALPSDRDQIPGGGLINNEAIQ